MRFGVQKAQNEPQNLKFVARASQKAPSNTQTPAADAQVGRCRLAPRPIATRHEKGPVAKTGPRGLHMGQARYWMRVRQ